MTTYDAQIRRLRAGEVYPPSDDPGSAAWQRVMVPIMSMAAEALANQTERLDRFSLPLLPPHTPDVRASATRAAQLFMRQLRSDYRRVASPRIDLVDVEHWRRSKAWDMALDKADVKNHSVGILAVGRYLASDRTADLATALKLWIAAEEHPGGTASYVASFGPVVGPVVQLALSENPDAGPEQLPSWASTVGDEWCTEFLKAAARELRPLPVQAPQMAATTT